ncbi:MAG: hypothetical protein FJZ86_06935 [Chloroflexi bacterium]|nr:hypothetical protein [Chloroflexota bacterium]
MTIECPICGKDDALQKVSSIVSGGTVRGSFSGPSGGVSYSGGNWGTVSGYTSLSGSTSTDLARLLSPPREPHTSFVNSGAPCIFLLVLLGCFFAAPIWSPIWYGVDLLSLLSPESYSGERGVALFFIGLAAVFGVIYALLWVGGIAYSKSQNKKESEKYSREKVIWDSAIEKWVRLYYCHRDDVVFDTQTTESFSPSLTSEYIHKQ